MKYFEVLGISPTKDIKLIRKAYSKLLPLYSPEKDPEGFQKLRTAYENAIKEANQKEPLEETLSPVDEFMLEFEEAYRNFEKRINIDSWIELLDRDICYNLNTTKDISHRILTFIMDNYNFPYEVWSLFDKYFFWSIKKDEFYQDFPNNFIDFVIYKANNKYSLRYEPLINCVNNLQDNFIVEYEKGLSALENNDLYNIKKAIATSEEICPHHPDLLVLKGRYLMTIGQIEEAHWLLTSVIHEYATDFDAYFYRGELLFGIGKVVDAYNDYKNAIIIRPQSVEAVYDLSKCCICLEKYYEAIEYLKNLGEVYNSNQRVIMLFQSANNFMLDYLIVQLESNPNDCNIKYELAEAYFISNKFEESYKLLCKLEQLTEFTNDMYLLLVKVLLALDKEEKAYEAVCSALQLFPQDKDLTFFKASILDDFNNLNESIMYYDKAIDLGRDDSLVFNNKAFVLSKLGRFDEALENCEKSLSIEPNSSYGYKNKAAALLGMGLFEDCLKACGRSININPYLIDSYIIQMKALIKIHHLEEATNVYDKAIDLGLMDSMLYCEKAIILRLTNNYNEAITYCDLALELRSDNAEIYDCKGLIYYNIENYLEAIKCFDNAIKYNNLLEPSYYNKILCLMKTSEYEMALTVIDNALNFKFDNLDEYYDLKGDVYDKLKEYEEALICYKEAIEYNPLRAHYYCTTGNTLIDLSRIEEALLYLDKAIELDPYMIRAHVDKSNALLQLHRYTEGIEQCDKALELDPNTLVAYQNKAIALYLLKRVDEAEKACYSALKLEPDNEDLLIIKLRILYAKELYKEALIVSDRILELNPECEDAIEIRNSLIEKNRIFSNPILKLLYILLDRK